jgi:tRNA nucleotidyltransferase (CCA-adding enzyme)
VYELLPADRVLADALPPGTLFAVGGRVRDELRREIEGAHAALKDLDYIVTGVAPAELEQRLRRVGRVDLVGASFAVFKVTIDGRTVDVALPRRERSTGSGHRDFAVESGPNVPLQDDLARRDFRMNMIARALPSGEIVDPYGGTDDIRARRIDILTPRTFEEDPLRMLRAAQFAARFAYAPTAQTRAAMTAAAPLAKTVSAERIAEEFTKLFVQAEKPSVGLELLRECGVLAQVWPELLEGVGVEQNEWHAYEVYKHNLETLDSVPPGDLILRLAALLHDVGKPRTKAGPHFYRHEQVGADMTREMLARLRFSNEITQTAEHLVRQHMYVADPDLSDPAIRRFIRRIGVANLDRQFALRAADIAGSGLPKRDDSNERFQARVYAEVARKPAFSIKDLQIDGDAVIDTMVRLQIEHPGFRGDRRVGDALQHLFEQVTERPERNEPATLRTLLEQYLAQERRGIST